MIIFQVTIPHTGNGNTDELVIAASEYIGALQLNAQLGDTYLYGWKDGAYVAVVQAPAEDSMDAKFLSNRGRKALNKIVQMTRSKPQWKALAYDIDSEYATAKGAPFLYLAKAELSDRSPLRRGDNGIPILLYGTSMDDELREDVSRWASSYEAFDSVWIGSGALEMEAYRELADPDSELTREGREICKRIEQAFGIRTFYYLLNSRSEDEERGVVCPGCGEQRPFIAKTDNSQAFHEFHMKCESCQFVSHIGGTF